MLKYLSSLQKICLSVALVESIQLMPGEITAEPLSPPLCSSLQFLPAAALPWPDPHTTASPALISLFAGFSASKKLPEVRGKHVEAQQPKPRAVSERAQWNSLVSVFFKKMEEKKKNSLKKSKSEYILGEINKDASHKETAVSYSLQFLTFLSSEGLFGEFQMRILTRTYFRLMSSGVKTNQWTSKWSCCNLCWALCSISSRVFASSNRYPHSSF